MFDLSALDKQRSCAELERTLSALWAPQVGPRVGPEQLGGVHSWPRWHGKLPAHPANTPVWWHS